MHLLAGINHIAILTRDLDRFAILRERLIARGACDGTVAALGPYRSLWFTDPDGMRGELTVIIAPSLSGIHAPRPTGTAHGQDTRHHQ